MEAPTEEKDFWPFGLTDEPANSLSGVTDEGTSGSTFMIDKGLVGESGALEPHHRVSKDNDPLPGGGAHDPLPVAHLWQLSFYRKGLMNPNRQLEKFSGITSAEDGSALKAD